MDVTLVAECYFDTSGVCIAVDTDFIKKNLKRRIAAPSTFPLASHSKLNLYKNLIDEIGFKGSELCDFICADILLLFWETV